MQVVLLLELDGRHESDLAVEPSVVEPVDVLGDSDLEVVDGLPWALVADQLGLEQRVERLGEGIEAPMSSGGAKGVFVAQCVADEGEGLASDVALEDTQSVVTVVAGGLASSSELAGSGVVNHAVVRDGPQGVIRGAVAIDPPR